jgi:glycosyltransferase involved in cell wall biosynthesis
MLDIEALVLTYNERENLLRTLRRLDWLPRVVVIDSFSTDGTVELARTFPNVTVIQREFDSFARQCNFGLKQIRQPWVLSLDADYELEESLIAEMNVLKPDIRTSGYRVGFRYCVCGRALRSTIYPPRTILYRLDAAHYETEGHGHRVRLSHGEVKTLHAKVRHDDRKPLSRWLLSQDRYMLIEAPHLLAADPSGLSRQDRLRRRAFLAPAVMFLYLMFARGLILDGWPGWYYVFQRTLAETLLALRLITERERLETSL